MKSTLLLLLFYTHVFASVTQASGLSDSELTALVEGDLKVASNVLEKELEAYPNDARLYKVAGDIYAVRAQGASIFSAPGLAKKVLASYKQAVVLEPDNTDYRMGLLQFYLFAPSIVGGSKKRAAAQATEIKKIDIVSGILAESLILLDQKDQDGLEQLFSTLAQGLSNNPRVKMAKANYLINMEQFNQAHELLTELVDWPTQSLTAEQTLLPYKAMLQIGFLANKSVSHQEAGITALKRYLDAAPVTYKLTSKKWVRLFLGELYASAGQTDVAKSVLIAAKSEANDKNLLNEINKALKKLK